MKDGKYYYYRPHRRLWGVFLYDKHNDGISTGEFIRDFPTKEEARKEVYRLNGWIMNVQ